MKHGLNAPRLDELFKKLYDIFDSLIEEIAATPEYKNINKSELFQLYHDIPGSIWSGAALTTLLPRFYSQKIKKLT